VASTTDTRFAAVAIGASTGGPEALREIVPALPADLPVPVLVVQHIPAAFSGPLAARLGDLGRLPVAEAVDGMPVERGRVYLAPGGRHLTVERTPGGVRCRLDDSAPVHGCRPSFDVLLGSAVAAYEGKIAAAVLTGMGIDGLEGCRAVKARGGFVVAQHRESCAVWGMPKAVEENGLADVVARLEDVAGVLTTAARSHPRTT
jgi:two-component system chemotaxis response regulator CheB